MCLWVLPSSVLKAGRGDSSCPVPRVQSRSISLSTQAACLGVLLPQAVQLLWLQGHGAGDGCMGSPSSPAQGWGPGMPAQVSLCCVGCRSAQHHVPGPLQPLPPSLLGLRSGLSQSRGTTLAAAPFPA